MNTADYIQRLQSRIGNVLDKQLNPRHIVEPRLLAAMRYAVMGNGKRLRPVLAYAGAEAVTGHPDSADIPACAVELIHGYSLIHDDLPAMDDDSLRRGRPTCHIRFGEATAILAGDALQTLAFQLLSESSQLSVGDRTRLRMIGLLSNAAGGAGMVSGQSLDFQASGNLLDEAALADMHALKTGALIRASVLLGALSTGVASAVQLEALSNYATAIGLAFQVQDDILDVVGDTRTLGKTNGRDQSLNKPTYVSMLGVEGARVRAGELIDIAVSALDEFGEQVDPLRGLSQYVVSRNY